MSLSVYPYKRNMQTGQMIDLEEQVPAPYNDLFGPEAWRQMVWGSKRLKDLNCPLLNSLRHKDIYAEYEEIQQLKSELERVKEQIITLANELDFEKAALEFRLNNALEAIRIAQNYENGGVCIG